MHTSPVLLEFSPTDKHEQCTRGTNDGQYIPSAVIKQRMTPISVVLGFIHGS
jgi:hypothetical protein